MDTNIITVGGVALPLLVVATVQALRFFGLANDANVRWITLAVALSWAALWVVLRWYPQAGPVAETIIAAYVAALVAAGIHNMASSGTPRG